MQEHNNHLHSQLSDPPCLSFPHSWGKSLEAELKLAKISNVGIHNLSPGMVTTELLMSGADTKGAKFFINCLGKYRSTTPHTHDVLA